MGRKSFIQKNKEQFDSLPTANKIRVLELDILDLQDEISSKQAQIRNLKVEN